MKNVKFAFTQIAQHLHPDLETQIEYAGVAQINGAEVWIKCLTATQNLLIKGAMETDFGGVTEPQCAELGIPVTLIDQSWANGAMGQLLGACRFHALNEAYRQEGVEEETKLAKFEAEHRNDNNSGFVPNPNDRKYMNADY